MLYNVSVNIRDFADSVCHRKAYCKNNQRVAGHGKKCVISQSCKADLCKKNVYQIMKKIHSEAQSRNFGYNFQLLFTPFYP